jgi:hypothetical protein
MIPLSTINPKFHPFIFDRLRLWTGNPITADMSVPARLLADIAPDPICALVWLKDHPAIDDVMSTCEYEAVLAGLPHGTVLKAVRAYAETGAVAPPGLWRGLDTALSRIFGTTRILEVTA